MFYRCFVEPSLPLALEDRFILETIVAAAVLAESDEEGPLPSPKEMTKRIESHLEEMRLWDADTPLGIGRCETLAWLEEQGDSIISFVAGSKVESRHREILGEALSLRAPELRAAVERLQRFNASREDQEPTDADPAR